MSGKLIFRRQKQNDFGMLKGRTPTTVPVDSFEIWRTYQRKSQKPAVLGDMTSKKYHLSFFFLDS